jgi:hypothetical protein
MLHNLTLLDQLEPDQERTELPPKGTSEYQPRIAFRPPDRNEVASHQLLVGLDQVTGASPFHIHARSAPANSKLSGSNENILVPDEPVPPPPPAEWLYPYHSEYSSGLNLSGLWKEFLLINPYPPADALLLDKLAVPVLPNSMFIIFALIVPRLGNAIVILSFNINIIKTKTPLKVRFRYLFFLFCENIKR